MNRRLLLPLLGACLALSGACLALSRAVAQDVLPADTTAGVTLSGGMTPGGMAPGGAFARMADDTSRGDDRLYDGGVKSTRLWLLGGSMAAGNAAIMAYYFTTYYAKREGERSAWHTFNDWNNADLNVDKLGHMYGSQMYARTAYWMFRWTNMTHAQSLWWSAALAWTLQFEMECTDGFYRKWGFSWWDIASNTAGAFWPVLQDALPALRAVNLKMSYWPSPAAKAGWVEYPLVDYDGYTYWLALSVEDVLPAPAKPYWPDWLGVALGYGADRTLLGRGVYNSDAANRGLGDRQWYLALDYDLRRLPGSTPLLRFMKEMLNLFHWPSPAVRIAPGTVWYGLYF
jgi:hypothetical protein